MSTTLKLFYLRGLWSTPLDLLTTTPERLRRTCFSSRGQCLGVLTCPQTDDNTHVLSTSLHNNGSQDLAAEQGGLETVGESIEAAVAQHSYLVVEGAPSEGKLWGQEQCQDPSALPVSCVSVGKGAIFSHPHLAP